MGELANSTERRSEGGNELCLVLFPLAVCGLYAASLYSYLLFHTAVELFCVFVMFAAFLLAWNSRRLLDNHYLLFLALSFLSSGVLELLHMVSYKGVNIFPGNDANIPTQFWIAFRYVFSLSLLAAPLFITRKLDTTKALIAFAIATTLLTAAIFSGFFPDCFVEGEGLTPFKVWSEYIIVTILLAAIAFLHSRRSHFDPRVLRALMLSLACAIAAEISFTRYVSVYGPANLVGHLFQFLSALLLYRALIVTGVREPAALLFRDLELSREAFKQSQEHLQTALEERTKELDEKELLAYSASRLLESAAPRQLVDELCHKVMSYLECHAFFNYLMDEKTGALHLNACAGVSTEEAEKIERLELGVAVCGCAARDACRIVAEDIPGSRDARTELVKSLGIKAYACHPLLAQGKVLGTLSFGTRTRNAFSGRDLALMKAVADQVAIAMDRSLMEETLRQAKQNAEAASRTKSQFVANMSHELRTPMTGMLGMLDLALQAPAEARQLEYIRTAQRSGRSLLRILNDILDLAKVEAGKFALDERPFRLRACLHEMTDVLMPESVRRGIELDVEAAEDLPDTLVGDQVRLRQVLTNLAGNAVKFTERGRVQVRARLAGRSGETVEILFSVSDTGIGIPVDKTDLLFKPFSQVDDSHSRSYGGTGLGLAISKEIVERMGGSIAVESQEGKGSTFTFTVRLGVSEELISDELAERAPATESHPSAVQSPPAEQRGGKRLLIAEDDPTIRAVLGDMLTRLNYQVQFAEDGGKVVEMWQQSEHDMILMDVQMPRVDGFQATAAIRAQEERRGGHIPILAMTAHAMREDQLRCLAAGMDDYISKPIDFRECLEKIKKALREVAPSS